MTKPINPGILTAAKLYCGVLQTHFDAIDEAESGIADGALSRADLEAAARNSGLPLAAREAAQEVAQDPAVFELIDTVTAPGQRDWQLSLAEIRGVSKLQPQSWFSGQVTFDGQLETANGVTLPESKTLSILSMDDKEMSVIFGGQTRQLKACPVLKTTTWNGFDVQDFNADAWKTENGSYLRKYNIKDANGFSLDVYVNARKPETSRFVSADLEIFPKHSKHASFDPTLDASDIVGLRSTEPGLGEFVDVSRAPTMPHEIYWALYDGLKLPTA